MEQTIWDCFDENFKFYSQIVLFQENNIYYK